MEKCKSCWDFFFPFTESLSKQKHIKDKRERESGSFLNHLGLSLQVLVIFVIAFSKTCNTSLDSGVSCSCICICICKVNNDSVNRSENEIGENSCDEAYTHIL